MKTFAVALIAATAVAGDYGYGDDDHVHHDHNAEAASGMPLNLPNFSDQVDAFEMRDELFGTDNYQLQVAKTANMLIATEALRLSTANLQNRVEYAQSLCDQNASDIDENASDIDDNQSQIEKNAMDLEDTADRLDQLEHDYSDLEHEKDIDRAVIVKMCHQYAYASTLVDECWPILEDMDPMPHRWYWPDNYCEDSPDLPPFNNHVPKSDKDTEHDSDDDTNSEIEEPHVKEYPSHH